MEEIKNILIAKFEEIHRRLLLVLDQLEDDQVNWQPNESSNSISNLVIHINSNVKERIGKGMNHKAFERNRDAEFEKIYRSKHELIPIVNDSFSEIIETLKTMNQEQFSKSQFVRGRKRSHLDMFIQCAAHFSEHMGQIFYIGKMVKDEDYKTTSI